MHEFLSYGKQWIDTDDIEAVINTLKSDYLTQGPKIDEFEKAICEYTGAKFAVAVSNATAALHIAVQALNIEYGKEGITSPNTFVASANCFLYNRLKPIFADIDEKTYNISLDEIKTKITSNTGVIVPVHFAGQPVEMEKLFQLANKQNIKIIEDASHAIGSKYSDGSMVGNCKYSEMTVFSFHPVKHITTCEGGAITTNDKSLYDKLRELRSHGITREKMSQNPGPWYYEMTSLGFNYRMTDVHATLGISQLKKLNKYIERRKQIVNQYNEAFARLDNVTTPYEKFFGFSAFHLYVLKIDFDNIKRSRKQIMEELKSKNIGVQVHYIPVHTQPYYTKNYGYKYGDYPVAEKYYEQALSIPLFPKMTDEDVSYVIKNINSLIKK